MSFFKLSLLVIAFCITGCVQPQAPITVTLNSTFNEEEAKNLLKDGTNTIQGNAFMRQLGGGVVTCAGNEVFLTPVTAYATERIVAIYGNSEMGFSQRHIQFIPDIKAYKDLAKKTQCNSQGNFKFDKVTDGTFYVVTSIRWQVANSIQGGVLMKKVSVKNGEVQDIIMAN
jgi:hypothetical protein